MITYNIPSSISFFPLTRYLCGSFLLFMHLGIFVFLLPHCITLPCIYIFLVLGTLLWQPVFSSESLDASFSLSPGTISWCWLSGTCRLQHQWFCCRRHTKLLAARTAVWIYLLVSIIIEWHQSCNRLINISSLPSTLMPFLHT